MSARLSTTHWLRTYMTENKEVPSRKIQADAAAAGFKWPAIQKARQRMSEVRVRYSGGWPATTTWAWEPGSGSPETLEPRIVDLENRADEAHTRIINLSVQLCGELVRLQGRLTAVEERLAALEIQSIS